MSMLSNLVEHRTGELKVSDFDRKIVAEIIESETGEVRKSDFYPQDEYELRATLAIRFWANPAQKQEARLRAEKMLLQTLHQPILVEIARIRSAVMDGDADAVLRAADRIQSAIGL